MLEKYTLHDLHPAVFRIAESKWGMFNGIKLGGREWNIWRRNLAACSLWNVRSS